MKIVLFGASGMVGQGALRECLLNPAVTSVVVVTRRSLGQAHVKLREIIHDDYLNLTPIEDRLQGCDACFYTVGVTSLGTSELDYRRITYDFTVAAAQCLARVNPNLTFVFVSASGADASEDGPIMWARVKGKAENAVQRIFKNAYALRPMVIQPLHGITSRTKLYRVFYKLTAPFIAIWTALFPGYVTTTERLGRAMIQLAQYGSQKHVLDSLEINQLSEENRKESVDR